MTTELIKSLFNDVQPSVFILQNNAFFHKNLEGVLLVIAWSRHPLEKIWPLESKFMQRLGTINPQGIVLMKNLYYPENSPPRKKSANV